MFSEHHEYTSQCQMVLLDVPLFLSMSVKVSSAIVTTDKE